MYNIIALKRVYLLMICLSGSLFLMTSFSGCGEANEEQTSALETETPPLKAAVMEIPSLKDEIQGPILFAYSTQDGKTLYSVYDEVESAGGYIRTLAKTGAMLPTIYKGQEEAKGEEKPQHRYVVQEGVVDTRHSALLLASPYLVNKRWYTIGDLREMACDDRFIGQIKKTAAGLPITNCWGIAQIDTSRLVYAIEWERGDKPPMMSLAFVLKDGVQFYHYDADRHTEAELEAKLSNMELLMVVEGDKALEMVVEWKTTDSLITEHLQIFSDRVEVIGRKVRSS